LAGPDSDLPVTPSAFQSLRAADLSVISLRFGAAVFRFVVLPGIAADRDATGQDNSLCPLAPSR
jgi:hypothetical protein